MQLLSYSSLLRCDWSMSVIVERLSCGILDERHFVQLEVSFRISFSMVHAVGDR